MIQVASDEDESRPANMILDLVLSEHVTELVFTAAAAVGIAAAAYLTSDGELSERLRKATIILYLYIIVCLSIHATILVFKEKEDLSESPGPSGNSQLP